MGTEGLSPDSIFKARDSGMSVKIDSQLLIGAILFLFLMVLFTFFIYMYAKTYWLPRRTVRRRHYHVEFAEGEPSVATRGLDPIVLCSLPVTIFSRSEFTDGIECSVCLTELSDGEEARLLPKCSHGFHLQCIDMWFQSHSTCPLCRCFAGPEDISGDQTPAASFRAEQTQFFMNEGRVSAGGFSGHPNRSLVITVPERVREGGNSGMSSPAEVARSPGMAKLMTLRRFLSRRSGSSSCSSPAECDVERGLGRDGVVNGERSSILGVVEN